MRSEVSCWYDPLQTTNVEVEEGNIQTNLRPGPRHNALFRGEVSVRWPKQVMKTAMEHCKRTLAHLDSIRRSPQEHDQLATNYRQPEEERKDAEGRSYHNLTGARYHRKEKSGPADLLEELNE